MIELFAFSFTLDSIAFPVVEFVAGLASFVASAATSALWDFTHVMIENDANNDATAEHKITNAILLVLSTKVSTP